MTTLHFPIKFQMVATFRYFRGAATSLTLPVLKHRKRVHYIIIIHPVGRRVSHIAGYKQRSSILASFSLTVWPRSSTLYQIKLINNLPWGT